MYMMATFFGRVSADPTLMSMVLLPLILVIVDSNSD